MPNFCFKTYPQKIKKIKNKTVIWDWVRKKFVALNHEELVRQQVIQYLVQEKSYPIALMNSEKGLDYAQRQKRVDIVAYQPDGKIFLLIECKAPEINLSSEVIEQVCAYNHILKARFVLVCNGLAFRVFEIFYDTSTYQELDEIPAYTFNLDINH